MILYNTHIINFRNNIFIYPKFSIIRNEISSSIYIQENNSYIIENNKLIESVGHVRYIQTK